MPTILSSRRCTKVAHPILTYHLGGQQKDVAHPTLTYHLIQTRNGFKSNAGDNNARSHRIYI
ncbi:MAG: hypothetical protein KAI83_03975 [Thiomargarita sp.]|nr:hypothetical protein [Thiomargarita sp.]